MKIQVEKDEMRGWFMSKGYGPEVEVPDDFVARYQKAHAEFMAVLDELEMCVITQLANISD